ncbi:GLUG motif-containing protein [Pelobium manganitolerans]|uniref:GLUG motif-containing protein n=1 Tax=Pelobium manganitolerans TaxID=1842495 RepID=UPI003FA3B758
MKKILRPLVLFVIYFVAYDSLKAQTISINNATELAKIGTDPAYPLDASYKQTADINLSGYANWTPIGTFTGSYDGQYHSISNLTITGTGKSYQGLFSQLGEGGQLKNLHLKNVNINLEGDSEEVGALVGYSRGQIYRVAVLSGTVKGYEAVGGLAGWQISPATVSESYANVTVQGNSYVYSTLIPGIPDIVIPGTPGYWMPMPGMPGPGMWMPGTPDTVIPGTPDQNIEYKSYYLGALLGGNQNGGQVSNSYATGSVTGNDDVGGLVGYNTANGSIISNSYASGSVSGSGWQGGLVGLAGGDASNCYWNTTTSGQSNGNGTGVTGKTDTEMKQQATFAGWDFTNIWEVEEGVSQPSLRWMTLTPLPVSLLSFKAHTQTDNVKLTWQTASESINKEFVIYRSGDQQNFEKLITVAGSGNSSTLKNYYCYDNEPLNGNNYYKLVQIDENGKETNLGLTTVRFDLSEISLQIYPNPTANKVNISLGKHNYKRLNIVNLNGKILDEVMLKPEQNNLAVSLVNYTSGTYLFRFEGAEGVRTEKVLKK